MYCGRPLSDQSTRWATRHGTLAVLLIKQIRRGDCHSRNQTKQCRCQPVTCGQGCRDSMLPPARASGSALQLVRPEFQRRKPLEVSGLERAMRPSAGRVRTEMGRIFVCCCGTCGRRLESPVLTAAASLRLPLRGERRKAAIAGTISTPSTTPESTPFNETCQLAMATRNSKTSPPVDGAQKLRQTQAEYSASRPAAEPGARTMMSSSKMYVCRRCHANFKTGDGKPDLRMPGLGKCNACVAASAAAAAAASGSAPT